MLGYFHVLSGGDSVFNLFGLPGRAVTKMNNWRKSLFVAACSAIFSSIRGPRASADETINPGQHAFIRRYVSAITSRNRAELKKLLHPTVLACMTGESRDFFDFMIDKEIGYSEALRGGYRIMRIEDFASAFSFVAPKELFFYSVAPTQEYQLDTKRDERGRSASLIRQIVFEDGRWFGLMACPTAKGLELFRAKLVKDRQQKALARDHLEKLAEPLRSRLKVLLGQRCRTEAIELFQSESRTDLTVAKLVIDALEEG
jgi:hypothetical protein